jgi:hypothetical protein
MKQKPVKRSPVRLYTSDIKILPSTGQKPTKLSKPEHSKESTKFQRKEGINMAQNEPKDFGSALTIVLNEGLLPIEDAIEETAKRFPKLYEAYEAEVRVLDDN